MYMHGYKHGVMDVNPFVTCMYAKGFPLVITLDIYLLTPKPHRSNR